MASSQFYKKIDTGVSNFEKNFYEKIIQLSTAFSPSPQSIENNKMPANRSTARPKLRNCNRIFLAGANIGGYFSYMKRRTFVGSIMAICPAAMASVAPAPKGGLEKYDVLVVGGGNIDSRKRAYRKCRYSQNPQYPRKTQRDTPAPSVKELK